YHSILHPSRMPASPTPVIKMKKSGTFDVHAFLNVFSRIFKTLPQVAHALGDFVNGLFDLFHGFCLTRLLVIANGGRLRVRAGAEIAESHERLGAGVIEDHAIAGGLVADEDFVLG